jgi:hypothetical protein
MIRKDLVATEKKGNKCLQLLYHVKITLVKEESIDLLKKIHAHNNNEIRSQLKVWYMQTSILCGDFIVMIIHKITILKSGK